VDTSERNLLSDYLHFAEGNESPRAYHVWCCLSLVSAVISRRVWLDYDYFVVRPWLYVVLVDEPGSGKTVAMDISRRFIHRLNDTGDQANPKVPVSASCESKEVLIKTMLGFERAFIDPTTGRPSLYTPLTIIVSELSQYIGIDPHRMIDFLVAVNDDDVYRHRTLRHGLLEIPGPHVTMLACTTRDWAVRYIRGEVFTGGFARRCIFVHEPMNYTPEVRRPFLSLTDSQRAARDRVFAEIVRLHEKGPIGQFKWSDDGRDWFYNWYKYRTISNDLYVRQFDMRVPMPVLRVAMLLSLCKSDELVLTKESLMLAKALLDRVIEQLPKVFRAMGKHDQAEVADKILSQLTLCGAVPEKVIQASMFGIAGSQIAINQTIAHLVTTDQVRRYADEKGRVYLAITDAASTKMQSQRPVAEQGEGSSPSTDP